MAALINHSSDEGEPEDRSQKDGSQIEESSQIEDKLAIVAAKKPKEGAFFKETYSKLGEQAK